MANLNDIRTACTSISDVKETMKQWLEDNNDVRHIREELRSSLSGKDFIDLPHEHINRVFSWMAPKDGEFQPMDAETQKSLDTILEYPGTRDAINKALGTVIRAMRTNQIAKSRYFPEFKEEDAKWEAQNKFFEEFYDYDKDTGMADISRLVLLVKWEQRAIKESSETLSQYIDANYIDELLQNKSLHPQSKKQIENIKALFAENPNSKINKNRLSINNGFVVIDGFGLPIKTQPQKYIDMAKENSDQLYPDFAITLLNFTAELKGKTFDRWKLDRKSLTDRTLWEDEILRILSTDDNKNILELLSSIVGEISDYKYIPMGVSESWYIIYASLGNGFIGFSSNTDHNGGCHTYYDKNCLAPLHIGE